MLEFLVLFVFVALIWQFLKSSVMIVVGLLEWITGSATRGNVAENPLVKNVRKKASQFCGKKFSVSKLETHHLGGLTLYFHDIVDTQAVAQMYFETGHPDYDRLINIKKGDDISFIAHKNTYHSGNASLESAYLSLK